MSIKEIVKALETSDWSNVSVGNKAIIQGAINELKSLSESRLSLAQNALEMCNDVFCAGYHESMIYKGMMESTGNRNKFPHPIKTVVETAIQVIADEN